MKGFIVFDYQSRMARILRGDGPVDRERPVKSQETVVDGLESMPDAFLGLFSGENTGKMLVRL